MKQWITRLSVFVLALGLTLTAHVHGRETQLQSEDVPVLMREIFQHHVDKHQMTEDILQRSLKVYIDQFDSQKTYLLESEVSAYLNRSSSELSEMLTDYRAGRLTVFEELTELIQFSIQRAQKNRQDWTAQLNHLFKGTVSDEDPSEDEDYSFATSERELQERQREHFLRFAEYQRSRVGDDEFIGRERDVLALYERGKAADEKPYLFEDEEQGLLGETAREHQLVLFVMKAMAKSLDAHTAFFSYAEAYDMRVRLEKGFKGVGIVLQEGLDGVTITRLIEGGPAARAGVLQEGDRIVSVDGQSIVEYSFEKVLDLIRGPEGSVVNLGIKRKEVLSGGRPYWKNFETGIVREPITISEDRVDMSWKPHENGVIGKLTLHSFYEGSNGVSSVRDMRNAIRKLASIGPIKGLILDLRENTGGFLMQAVKVAGLFIPSGIVVVSKYGKGDLRYFRDIDGHAYYDGPLVILTSRLSASAAEIVAQSLQDYGVGIVVGDEVSYGKGTVQLQTVTDDNSSSFFKVTVGRYYTVSGESTQIRGVQADIVVPTAFHDEKIGERFLDYPLPHDQIKPLFTDSLEDLGREARRWYERHYLPSVAEKQGFWKEHLPILRQRSAERIAENRDYQKFIQDASIGSEMLNIDEEEEMDLPMGEAFSIVEDMIEIKKQTTRH